MHILHTGLFIFLQGADNKNLFTNQELHQLVIISIILEKPYVIEYDVVNRN